MAASDAFDNVPSGSRLDIEVRQEGEQHLVKGQLRHDGHGVPLGELEDRVTSVILGQPGWYQLVIQIAFFGRLTERVDIRLSVENPQGGRLREHRREFTGSSGDAHLFSKDISVV